MTNDTQANSAPTLPTVGKSRWMQLQHFIPVSRGTWHKLVVAGKAPQPQRLSERCTMYDNREVHRWLADPVNYQVASGVAA